MEPVSTETVYAAVEILGGCKRVNAAIKKRLRALVAEDITVQRLVDIIPEAFGMVLASHLTGVGAETMKLPTAFSVKNAAQEWRSVPIKSEPVFVAAIQIAQHIFHHGPRQLFRTHADRSGIVDMINKTLNLGGSLDGSTAELFFNNLPACLYEPTQG